MRSFLRRVAAALVRLRASVAEVALVAVRGVDGALAWVWQVVNLSSVAATVDYLPAGYDIPEPRALATDRETLDAGMRIVGEQVVRAAREMLTHGKVCSGDIAVDIVGWVRCLCRDDLRVLAEADTLTAGRHVAGVEPIRDIVGHPIPRPDPAGDVNRLAKRRELEEKHRVDERAIAAAVRQRREQERDWEWTAGLDATAFVPSL